MTAALKAVIIVSSQLFAVAAMTVGCSNELHGSKQAERTVAFAEYEAGQVAQFSRLYLQRIGRVDYRLLAKKIRKRYRRMDANNDKTLTRVELERGRRVNFDKADLNKDGTLQSFEWHPKPLISPSRGSSATRD